MQVRFPSGTQKHFSEFAIKVWVLQQTVYHHTMYYQSQVEHLDKIPTRSYQDFSTLTSYSEILHSLNEQWTVAPLYWLLTQVFMWFCQDLAMIRNYSDDSDQRTGCVHMDFGKDCSKCHQIQSFKTRYSEALL